MTDKEKWIDCEGCYAPPPRPNPDPHKGYIWVEDSAGNGRWDVCGYCMGRGVVPEKSPPPPLPIKRTLSIVIEAGETTCARKPKKFCRYAGSKRFGTLPVCMLFPSEDGSFTALEDKDGWLQRLPQCIEAEKATQELAMRQRIAEL